MNLADILLGSASSGFLGILGSLATGVMNFFQRKQDHAFKISEMKEERETMRLRIDLKQVETAGQLAVEREKGAADAFTASIQAEGRLKGEHRWITSFRAFTRPGLTWYFVLWSTAVTVAYIMGAVAISTISDPIQQYALVTLYNTTSMLVTWWFGQRQIDKMTVEWGNRSAGARLSSSAPAGLSPAKTDTIK